MAWTDDTEDFRSTMKTLWVGLDTVSTFRDLAYGAALGLIYWSDLSSIGQASWLRAAWQNEAQNANVDAQSFFRLLLRFWNQISGPRRCEYPWSLTDPDFMLCNYIITSAINDRNFVPIDAGQFQARYLKNLRHIELEAADERLTNETMTFLRSGMTEEMRQQMRGIPAEMRYLYDSSFYVPVTPARFNLLSNEDWGDVQRHLARSQFLRERYEDDARRRLHLADKGLSVYYRLPVD